MAVCPPLWSLWPDRLASRRQRRKSGSGRRATRSGVTGCTCGRSALTATFERACRRSTSGRGRRIPPKPCPFASSMRSRGLRRSPHLPALRRSRRRVEIAIDDSAPILQIATARASDSRGFVVKYSRRPGQRGRPSDVSIRKIAENFDLIRTAGARSSAVPGRSAGDLTRPSACVNDNGISLWWRGCAARCSRGTFQ
jgi:hypothetical protein